MQRGIETISEASRHLPPGIKARHPDIPWIKVAGIGNILRHGYEEVAAPILWKLAREASITVPQMSTQEDWVNTHTAPLALPMWMCSRVTF